MGYVAGMEDRGARLLFSTMLSLCAVMLLAIYVTDWRGGQADALFGTCLFFLAVFALGGIFQRR